MLNEITKIKLELLCNGIIVSKDILERFPGYRYKRASLSEGLCFDLFPESYASAIPINLAIHEKFVVNSPFSYDEVKKMILKNGREFIRASIIDFPAWYSKTLPDGPRFQEIFQIHYSTILATSLTNFCEYKNIDKGCQFCAMGYQIDKPRTKSAEDIKSVLKKILEMDIPITEVNLNSGTLLDDRENLELYLNVIKGIREVTNLPIYAQICPPRDISFIDELTKAGLTSISFNLEIYDSKLRKKLMPAKGSIPVHVYTKAISHAVKILGQNSVSSWLVAGLEPAESSIAGIKHIASLDAVPFVTVFRPLIGSEFENENPPDPNSIFPIFEALGVTLRNMKFNPDKTSCGCVKCNCCSALTEVIS